MGLEKELDANPQLKGRNTVVHGKQASEYRMVRQLNAWALAAPIAGSLLDTPFGAGAKGRGHLQQRVQGQQGRTRTPKLALNSACDDGRERSTNFQRDLGLRPMLI